MKFDWAACTRDQFERAVQLLLERKHEKARTTFAPDGRGGDEGIDFLAQDRTLTIYQLKHYPDGLKSSTKSRKRSIKESFETAVIKRAPRTWVLVLPALLTVPERKYVEGLTAPAGYKQPNIRVYDLTKLDLLLTKYPEIRDHLDREPLLDAIEERQIEQAEPRDIDDILRRAVALTRRAGHLDPDWDVDLFVRNGVPTAIPRPKHDKAVEKSPLGLEITVDLRRVSAHVRATIERSLGYGSGETVTIPGEAIASLTTTGPQWQWLTGEGDFALEPILPQAPDALVRLVLTDADGHPLGEHEGPISHAAPGAVGYTLAARFYNGLTTRLLLPKDAQAPGQADLSVSVHRLFPADARDALTLFRLLGTPGVNVEVLIDDKRLVSLTPNGSARVESDVDRDVLEQFANHLDQLQRHARVRRTLPTNVTLLDRASAAAALHVLEGRCTFLPESITFTATIDTGGEQQWIDQLRETLSNAHAMFARLPSLTLDVAGLPVNLGPVALYSPSVSIKDAQHLLPLLDEGRIDGQRITYVAAPEAGWRVAPISTEYMPLSWTPAPWKLRHSPEHRAFINTRADDGAHGAVLVEVPDPVHARTASTSQRASSMPVTR